VGLVDAAGASVLVLGAGGGAQAVATSLLDAGAEALSVAARDAEHAHALAARLRTLFPERKVDAGEEWPPATRATLVVNATPIRDELPVELEGARQFVDLAYKADRSPTALVEAAREAGCQRVVDGVDVLIAQGAASFERWTEVPAPLGVMRSAVGR
jgi:shikimate dehydrogenase